MADCVQERSFDESWKSVNKRLPASKAPHPLAILGLDEHEEGVYRWLLSHPGANATNLAQSLALTAGKARQLLGGLEGRGLVTSTPERSRRFVPVRPDIALRALIAQRHEQLLRVEGMLDSLQKQAEEALAPGEPERMVELITSRAAEQQIFEHMQRSARREIVSLIRSPMLVSRLEAPFEADQTVQKSAQSRGVRYRAIADSEFLSLPGALARLRSDMAAGEEVRVTRQLALKMIMSDRRFAIIPLSLEKIDGPSLLVRSSALLDALYGFFELLWERAVPLAHRTITGGGANSGEILVTEEDRTLLSLMETGINDKRIVDELGISRSTYSRRVAELMEKFDARTRYQLGRQVALRDAAIRRSER